MGLCKALLDDWPMKHLHPLDLQAPPQQLSIHLPIAPHEGRVWCATIAKFTSTATNVVARGCVQSKGAMNVGTPSLHVDINAPKGNQDHIPALVTKVVVICLYLHSPLELIYVGFSPKVFHVCWERTASKVAPVKSSLKFLQLNNFIHF